MGWDVNQEEWGEGREMSGNSELQSSQHAEMNYKDIFASDEVSYAILQTLTIAPISAVFLDDPCQQVVNQRFTHEY